MVRGRAEATIEITPEIPYDIQYRNKTLYRYACEPSIAKPKPRTSVHVKTSKRAYCLIQTSTGPQGAAGQKIEDIASFA